MAAQDIIIRPVITEKSMSGMASKKYTFEVCKDANKIEIAKAVEELFGVKVSKVNTLHVRGHMRRQGRYEEGRRHPERGQQAHRVLRRHDVRGNPPQALSPLTPPLRPAEKGQKGTQGFPGSEKRI